MVESVTPRVLFRRFNPYHRRFSREYRYITSRGSALTFPVIGLTEHLLGLSVPVRERVVLFGRSITRLLHSEKRKGGVGPLGRPLAFQRSLCLRRRSFKSIETSKLHSPIASEDHRRELDISFNSGSFFAVDSNSGDVKEVVTQGRVPK